jgi:hypothetical protein
VASGRSRLCLHRPTTTACKQLWNRITTRNAALLHCRILPHSTRRMVSHMRYSAVHTTAGCKQLWNQITARNAALLHCKTGLLHAPRRKSHTVQCNAHRQYRHRTLGIWSNSGPAASVHSAAIRSAASRAAGLGVARKAAGSVAVSTWGPAALSGSAAAAAATAVSAAPDDACC